MVALGFRGAQAKNFCQNVKKASGHHCLTGSWSRTRETCEKGPQCIAPFFLGHVGFHMVFSSELGDSLAYDIEQDPMVDICIEGGVDIVGSGLLFCQGL